MNQQELLETEHSQIRDLRAGQRVNGIFAVRERELRRKKNDEPWLRLVVGDATGTVEAVAWDDAERLFGIAIPGTVVEISGDFETSERWGSKIKIASLAEAVADSYDIGRLAPVSPVPLDALEQSLGELVASIERRDLRMLVTAVFASNSELGSSFREAPAAKGIHHAYGRGLMEHTLSVAEAVDRVAGCFPGVDREVAVVGALLHDIGKIESYSDDPLNIDSTDIGRLEGHIPVGYFRIRRLIEGIPEFDPSTAQAVLHIILSHHGSLEHGSPVVPATREAVLVHMIDNLGSTLGSFDRLERALPEGESWSEYDRALAGRAYFRASP